MSEKSKDPKALDRPFDPGVFKQARRIAAKYKIVMEFADGEWYGHGLELPGAMSDGKTPAQCIDSTRDAMAAVVASMIEDGQTPPAPARVGTRTQQVNVRLSVEEKAALEIAAQQRGYKGLGDYLRSSALERSR
jgi:predicted RNase H-like HicB family nuclease